jgi:hypothetical protein
MNELVTVDTTQPRTVEALKAQIQTIQKVMRSVMKKGTHYGTIPGVDSRPTLLKPGSEVLLTTFHISCEPEVDDLSTSDEIRYRVRAVGRHQGTGITMGVGVGEASTNEEKYKWRAAVCEQEFDETPDDRKRIKWKRSSGDAYKIHQIRTNPADIANTVLKMAKKRAQVDMTLTVLGASDCFAQDLEDLPAEVAVAGVDERPPAQRPATQAPRSNGGSGKATAKQLALVRGRLDKAGVREIDLIHHLKIDELEDLPFGAVDDALLWIAQAS